ncbi:MAG: DUF4349 domain-containing protein [Acidimicrobiaceae bacterium]|nr:DUF4349 domain-containing protein [Acidimicrobiaceae bacterium]MXZ65787.1 DUF4349 domain-containing protein [Acidimicrobiaceae bacterium]MYF32506.1 DUF4349 domain-containing protein [Acidimicrobiaceae bacterium]MYJ82617.1 DUF4349 domain-containing protein [Acidimicrobiaceae bacterium]
MTYTDTPRVERRRGRAPFLFVLAVMSTVLLTACVGGGDEDDAAAVERVMATSAADAPADFAEEAPAEEAPMAEADEGTTTAGEASGLQAGTEGAALAVPTALTPVDLGRDIVYRATISVQADDVTAASNEAVAIVQGLGGIVFNQTTRTEPRPSAEITFKVLPADFSTALERLAGVGKLVDQSISADDVTERVVDLQSRISTAETSVTRLRKLLEEAVELEDVAQIERELLDRETTLEVLRGQLRTLRDQVDLATITLTIHQSPTVPPDTGIEVDAWISEDAEDPCLGAQHLTVDPDSTVYLCLEVENPGASALTEVSVRSLDVRLDTGAFETRQGGFDRIEPGELLVAVLEVPIEDGRLAGRVATRGLEIRLQAKAIPVDAQEAELPEVSGTALVWLDSRTDESLPGFADSVSEGAGFLRTIVGVVLVVVGVLVPFLPFLAVIAALVWWRRRRRRRGPRSERTPEPERRPRSRRRRAKAEVPAPPPPAPRPEDSGE